MRVAGEEGREKLRNKPEMPFHASCMIHNEHYKVYHQHGIIFSAPGSLHIITLILYQCRDELLFSLCLFLCSLPCDWRKAFSCFKPKILTCIFPNAAELSSDELSSLLVHNSSGQRRTQKPFRKKDNALRSVIFKNRQRLFLSTRIKTATPIAND